LSIEKQKELKRIEKNLSELVPYPDDPCEKTNNPQAHANAHFQIASDVINMAFDSSTVYTRENNVLATMTLKHRGVEPLTPERVKQVLEQQMRYLQDPDHLYQLIQKPRFDDHFDHVQRVVEQTLDNIRVLIEQRQKVDLTEYQRTQLVTENDKLSLIKKSLPLDKQSQLDQMNLQSQYDTLLCSKYQKLSQEQYQTIGKNACMHLFTKLLKKKNQLTTELEIIINEELLSIKDDDEVAMVTDHTHNTQEEEDPMMVKKRQLSAEIEQLENRIQPVIDIALSFIHDPSTLIQLSNHLKDKNEFDRAITLCEHTQREIEQLHDTHSDRLKIRQQLAELHAEQEEINELRKQSKNKGKRLEEDKQKLLDDLTLKVYIMDREPHYLNLTSSQLEKLHLDVATVMIKSSLDKREREDQAYEMKIASCTSESEKELFIKERQSSGTTHDSLIEKVIDRCMTFVKHPRYVMNLLEMIKKRNNNTVESTSGDFDLKQVIKLGNRVVEECGICEQRAHAREIPQLELSILEKEQTELEVLRKDLTESQKEHMESLKQKLLEEPSIQLPSYLVDSKHINYDEISNWRYNALVKMMDTLLDLKSQIAESINTAEQREESTEPLEKVQTKYHHMLQDDLMGLIKSTHTNVSQLSSMVTSLKNHKEYDLCVSLAQHVHTVINTIRKKLSDRVIPEQEYLLLEHESARLLTQRKQLTNEQQDQLRSLKLDHKLYQNQPKYMSSQSDATLDKIAYQLSHTMVCCALEQKAQIDALVNNDSQMDPQVAQQESESSGERVNALIDSAVLALAQSTCFGLENTIKILLHLNAQNQYPLVMRVGKICQDRIDRLRDLVITIHALEKEKQSLLSNKREDHMDSHATQSRIRTIDYELSRLPYKYKNRALLDHLDLNVAHTMMNASKIEDDVECLRQQSIKIFKVNMTTETFGEAKVWTPVEQWEKVRKELLQYVLDRIVLDTEEEANAGESYNQSDDFLDTSADNFLSFENHRESDSDDDQEEEEEVSSPSDSEDDEDRYVSRRKRAAPKRKGRKPAKKAKMVKNSTAGTKSSLLRRGSFKDRIELLLNEGMFKETIAVFPRPPKGTLDLLERLYTEMRKGDPKQLDGILPLVEEYVTKDYMQFDFTSSVTLLDMVEEHNRNFVIKMYENICEKLIVNLVPKQYVEFVNFLKAVKARLTKYGSDADATDDEEEEEEEEDTGKKKRATKKKAPKKKAPKRAPWEEFIENVKATHKGKKKLMSMVTMEDL